MSFLQNLINPPPTNLDAKSNSFSDDHYKYFNSVNNALNGLTSLRNDSVIANANFATLSAQGLTPTTPAFGDNFNFIGSWYIVGATAANYVVTATAYPSNSTIKSTSPYYVHNVVSSSNGAPFYFYQRLASTVRQFQSDYFTYSMIIQNNQSKAIKLQMSIFTYYDTGSNLVQGSTFFLQPGMNQLTSSMQTQSLDGLTVNSGNYTEFRINFVDLIDGTADIEIYQIKCEFGQIGTPL